MTLMPVTRISVSVDCSSKVGRRAVDRAGLVGVDRALLVDRLADDVQDAAERAAPTGTEIGPPVSITLPPRTRPSVASIAMVRTVDSPRCCATSSTRRVAVVVGLSAFRISGRCAFELHVDDGADDLGDLADCCLGHVSGLRPV